MRIIRQPLLGKQEEKKSSYLPVYIASALFVASLSVFAGCYVYFSDCRKEIQHELQREEVAGKKHKKQEERRSKIFVQEDIRAASLVQEKKDFKEDENFSLRIRPWKGGWDKRFGVTSATIIFPDYQTDWNGNRSMSRDEMNTLVRQTLRCLPHIKTNDDLVSLLIETMIVESDGGRLVASATKDYGAIQMKISTAKSLRSWTRENHKDVYDAVNSFRNTKLSERDNLIQNLPYAVAMMVTEYWRKSGQDFAGMLGTRENRAILWKSIYNTHLGAGTVQNFIDRSRQYNPKRKKRAEGEKVFAEK